MQYIAKILLSVLCVLAVALTPAGADVGEQLREAIGTCDSAGVERLVAGGADVNIRIGSDGNTPLHYAAQSRCDPYEVVRILIDAGAVVNAKDKLYRTTPLHWAALAGHPDAARLLIQAGAYTDAVDRDGKTPLSYAKSQENWSVVRVLENPPSKVEIPPTRKNINERLVAEIEHCKPEAIKGLIADGADISKNVQIRVGGEDSEGTFLHLASSACDSFEVIKILIDAGINVDIRNVGNRTPLFFAVIQGRIISILALIQMGADANVENNHGATPLHAAAHKGHTEVAIALIQAGANINAKEKTFGASPLHMAAFKENFDAVKALIEAGADINAKNKEGGTPLHEVASLFKREGYQRTEGVKIISALIQAGADINAKDNAGWTPLHQAATFGAPEIVVALIQAGADVNAKNSSGETPLHSAASNATFPRAEVVITLIEAGADVNAKSPFTPLDLAKLHNNYDVVRILENLPLRK